METIKMHEPNYLQLTAKGCLYGILFVSFYFWSLIPLMLLPETATIIAAFLLPPAVSALLGLMLAARQRRFVLYEFVTALPAAAVTVYCYLHFSILNPALQSLGLSSVQLSTGAMLALAMYGVYFVVCLPAGATAAISRGSHHHSGEGSLDCQMRRCEGQPVSGD